MPKKDYTTQKDRYQIMKLKRVKGMTAQRISDKLKIYQCRVEEFLESDELREISQKGKTVETVILKELTPGFSYVQEKVTIRYEVK